MDDRFNTVAGWALAGGVAALGLSIVSGMIFHSEAPEKMGYAVVGAEAAGGGGDAPAEPIAVRLAKADPAKGADVFKQCGACHTINQGGANGIGPNLWATLGEGIAQGKAGYAFSDPLKAIGGNWDFDKMDAWLTSPRKFAAGTKMTFAGLADPQARANVIAYLNSQGSNLPLPAAPAAGEAPADNGDNGAQAIENVANGASTANLSNEAAPGQGTPAKSKQNQIQAEEKAGLPKSNN